MQISQCLGYAVLDGNLKRKTFSPGSFFIVNQAEIETNKIQNILSKYQSQPEAEAQFKALQLDKKFAKILVDGSTGKIIYQDGDNRLVAQNLMYMYQHVQGTVFNGKY